MSERISPSTASPGAPRRPRRQATLRRTPARSLLIACSAALFLTSSVSAKKSRLPEPDPERGTLGVTVEMSPTLILRQVYFAKLEEGAEDLKGLTLVPGDVTQGRQVFLLNAEPGRWVAVAARLRVYQGGMGIAAGGGGVTTTFSPGGAEDFLTLFSSQGVASTQITVGPGEMVFMGRLTVEPERLEDAQEGDEVRAHYAGLVPREKAKLSLIPTTTSKDLFGASLNEFERDDETALMFWLHAREVCFKKAPAWKQWADTLYKTVLARLRAARESSG